MCPAVCGWAIAQTCVAKTWHNIYCEAQGRHYNQQEYQEYANLFKEVWLDGHPEVQAAIAEAGKDGAAAARVLEEEYWYAVAILMPIAHISYAQLVVRQNEAVTGRDLRRWTIVGCVHGMLLACVMQWPDEPSISHQAAGGEGVCRRGYGGLRQ